MKHIYQNKRTQQRDILESSWFKRFFCFQTHYKQVLFIFRKPVQLPWTGFLNLQILKPVFRFEPVLSDTSSFCVIVLYLRAFGNTFEGQYRIRPCCQYHTNGRKCSKLVLLGSQYIDVHNQFHFCNFWESFLTINTEYLKKIAKILIFNF